MASSISLSHLASILRVAADEADRLARLEAADRQDWIDQEGSPLGPRRHCAAVRARIAAGLPGATIVGRSFRLSPEALGEVAGEVSRPKAKRRTGSTTTEEKLQEALRRVGSDLWDQ